MEDRPKGVREEAESEVTASLQVENVEKLSLDGPRQA